MWLRFGKAPAPLISAVNRGKMSCCREDLTSLSRGVDTFPRNFNVRWMFSRSTGFKSPPNDCKDERIDATRDRTCGSSRSIEMKLRTWAPDKAFIDCVLLFLRAKSPSFG